MSYSNLHIEDSHIKFFSDNPFTSSATEESAKGRRVQIITENQNLGQQLIEQFHRANNDFEKVTVGSLGYLDEKGVSSIIPILKKAVSEQVVSIFIGFDKSILKAIFDGFQFSENLFNMSHIQDDIGGKGGIDTQILPVAAPYLHRLHLIGSQSMLTNMTFFEENEGRGLANHRLGQTRANLGAIEPEIRSSNIFSVNLNALKYSAAHCQSRKSPIGFEADEVCQLAHYAGRGERNQVFCVYEIDQEDLSSPDCQLLTNLIWYFLQGVEFRGSNFPPNRDQMKTYLIEGKIENLELEFYKDENQQKWWLKCPVKTENFQPLYQMIACDYEDYSAAINERILSDRLRNLIALL